MKAEEFLKCLLEYEQRVGRWYLRLGNCPSFSADLRLFWHCMAEDEQRHAGVLERSRRLMDLQQTAPQASDRVFHDIEKQLTAAEEAISHACIGVDEALRYAMLLESSEIDRLDQAWFHAFPPSLATLLLLLTPEDNLHLRRLVEAVHAFSTVCREELKLV